MPSLVCYAVKANSNQAVIATLARLGAGADVVSGGELKRALAAGVPPDKIMFSGIGKTAAELALALDEDILCVNVESEPELELLSAIAVGEGPHRRRVGARQSRRRCQDPRQDRDRPGREQVRHPDQPRPRRSMPHAAKLPGLRVAGVDMHIGSQITELTPFDNAFALLSDFVRELRADGHTHLACRSRRRPGHSLSRGQRAAARSRPPMPRWSSAPRAGLGCKLIFEPGRLIVGNAGILVTRVLYLKRGEAKTFVIVDAAMNDLVRPTLYDAHHDIRPVAEPAPGARRTVADVVGPVCESGDFLALDRDLVEPRPGDLLAVMSAGAYGAVQAGTYNTRPLVPEVLVRDSEWALVRPRLEVDQLIGLDRLPPWL